MNINMDIEVPVEPARVATPLPDDVLHEIRMAERDLAPYADGLVPRAAVEKARETLRRLIRERGGSYFYT